MITKLKGPKNFDLRRYAIGKLAQDIDSTFCDYFKTDRVFYYLESCRIHRKKLIGDSIHYTCDCCGTHRIIWHGKGIIGFINRALSLSVKEQNAPVLFVTPLKSKNKIKSLRNSYSAIVEKHERDWLVMRDYAAISKAPDNNHYQYLIAQKDISMRAADEAEAQINRVEYWIGDVSSDGYMICCDPMWGYLWDEIRKQH